MTNAARSLAPLALALGVALGAAAQEGDPPARAPIGVLKDVEFARAGDHALKLDLYRPRDRGKAPLPTVLSLHAGGWRSGDKSSGVGLVRSSLCGHGFALASPDYRLSAEAPFPAAVEDVKAAVRFLRANAARYHLDPDRIGAFGTAAGGHLALMLALTDKAAGLEGKGGPEGVSSAVQAAAVWSSYTDLTVGHEAFERGKGTSVVSFLGGTEKEKPALYRLASPLTHASRDDPPVLIAHAEEDEIIPVDQADRLEKKLRELGVAVTAIHVRNARHDLRTPVHGESKLDPASIIAPTIDELEEATREFFEKSLKRRD